MNVSGIPTLAQIASKQFVTATPDTSIAQTIASLEEQRQHQIRSPNIIVLDNQNKVVGLVGASDCIHWLSAINQSQLKLAQKLDELCTEPVVCLYEDNTLFEAIVMVQSQTQSLIPIIDRSQKLVGIVSESDIISGYFKYLESQRSHLENSVSNKIDELVKTNEELRHLSFKDSLMDIGNRRCMEVDLKNTHLTTERYERAYALVLFDLDYFKQYNDTYGHQAGDNLLKQIAAVLKESVRKSDRLYRYGGEEILLLLPETTSENALYLANQLVEKVKALGIEHKHSPHQVVTMSGGAAAYHHKGSTWQNVLKEADDALYKAKQQGRNHAQLYGNHHQNKTEN